MQAEFKKYQIAFDPSWDTTALFANRHTYARRTTRAPSARSDRHPPPPYTTVQLQQPRRAHVLYKIPSGISGIHSEVGSLGYARCAADYLNEEQIRHFDTTYDSHRRLIRTGIVTTIIYAAAFLAWAVCFPLALFDLKPVLSPAGRRGALVAETAFVVIAAIVYLVRALVNLHVRTFLGRVLQLERPLGCTQRNHDFCFNQQYLLYGGVALELTLGSMLVLEVVLCAFTWSIPV